MEEYYLIIKALHIISVMAWIAGLLYLPRLYVYHCEVAPRSEADKIFQVMEKKLLRYIMNPAMILSLVFGILLIIIVGPMNLTGWFHVKALALIFLFGAHGMLAKYRKDFANMSNKHTARFYRIVNEVPTILMIVIVILAVVKPF